MTFDCILTNGDSYTATTDKLAWPHYLANDIGVPVQNFAAVGSNNHRIYRSTVEAVLQHLEQGHRPMVLVAWSFITRMEIWYQGQDAAMMLTIPDRLADQPDYLQSRFTTLDWLVQQGHATLEQKTLLTHAIDFHKPLCDFYCDVFALYCICRANDIEFYNFFGADNSNYRLDNFPYIRNLRQIAVLETERKLPDPAFSIPDWAEDHDVSRVKETGHLSDQGHRDFAKFLRSNLINPLS